MAVTTATPARTAPVRPESARRRPARTRDGGFALSLDDGTRLFVSPADAGAVEVVSLLARAARLGSASSSAGARQLTVTSGERPAARGSVCVLGPREAPRFRKERVGAAVRLSRVVEHLPDEQWTWQQLLRLSGAIADETLCRGGVLLHAGLAAVDAPAEPGGAAGRSVGVLLAGRSGVGKSTASRRLQPPWRSLSDDVTLVVRAEAGEYRGHPWPTWSRLVGPRAGDGSDGWDVQESVPLGGVFVLEQGTGVRTERLGEGHAAVQLAELARQTAMVWPVEGETADLAAHRVRRFENVCALVRALPVFRLHTSLDGAFWREIERVLGLHGTLRGAVSRR